MLRQPSDAINEPINRAWPPRAAIRISRSIGKISSKKNGTIRRLSSSGIVIPLD
jgi:hypothetical protein